MHCAFIYHFNVFFPIDLQYMIPGILWNFLMKNSPETDIFVQNPNITIFFRQSIVQKLFNFKVICSLFNTEESVILIFSIFSMLFDLI